MIFNINIGFYPFNIFPKQLKLINQFVIKKRKNKKKHDRAFYVDFMIVFPIFIFALHRLAYIFKVTDQITGQLSDCFNSYLKIYDSYLTE